MPVSGFSYALRIVSAAHSPVSETRRNFPESDEVTVGRFVGFQVFVLSDLSVMVGTPLSSTLILQFKVCVLVVLTKWKLAILVIRQSLMKM